MKTCDDYPQHRADFVAAYHQALTLRAMRTIGERGPVPREEINPIYLAVRRAWVAGNQCTCAIGDVKVP